VSLVKIRVKHVGDMWVDPHDHAVGQRLTARGEREPGFMWILRHETHGLALDIGANIGYCSLTMAQRCDKVIAYEPDPRSWRTLNRNIQGNGKIVALPYALGAKDETRRFLRATRANLSRVTDIEANATVDVRTLDALHRPGTVDFIKMDIEGGEVSVIQGGRKLLSESPRIQLAMELHPERYNEQLNMRDELDWLLLNGFRFKCVENAKDKMCRFTDLGYTPMQTFGKYPRAIFDKFPDDSTLLRWCTEMPLDGKKVIRSILMERRI